MKTLDMQTSSSTRPISSQRNICRKLGGCRSRLEAGTVDTDTSQVKICAAGLT